ncbi:MAG: PA2169 family four-helix-bundle protein [Acidimicrobiia bacterium]|nr:PA2169 family four-helix-bundle protein [Acidimicrobiia bacterium]
MPDRNERWALNRLIEICRDEELTLRLSADYVKDQAIRTLLLDLASARARFAAALLPHAQRLGGADAADATMRGTLHRRWMVVKGALMGYDDRALIAEAEHDEDLAVATYDDALGDMLPPTVRDLVEQQRAEIGAARARLHDMLTH